MKINKRKIQYASMSSMFIAFFVVVVLLLNVLVGFLGDRFSLKIDLTASGEYSISDTTKEMLKSLEEEVTVYIMSSEANINKNENQKQAAETVQRFATASGGKIKYEYVDPNQNPKFYDAFPKARANKEGDSSAFLIVSSARRYSSILYSDIVATNQNQSALYYSTESELAGAVLYATSPELSKVAYITGHNELDLPGLENIFDGNGFEHVKVNLSKEDIPEGVNNVVIAAPDFDFTVEEIAKIDKFMATPGSNLYVFWSRVLTTELPVLERFLSDWGFDIEQTTVLDQQYAYQSPYLPVCEVQANDVTARVPSTQQIFLAPQAHPIKLLFEQRGNMRTLPIAKTMATSFARMLASDANITDARKDGEEKGPFNIAAVSEKVNVDSKGQLEEFRVFLFGSESAAEEDIMGLSASLNNTVFNELVSYANPDANTMAIAPKMQQTYDLNFYESEIRVLFVVLVILVPLAILAAGIFIFIRRRHK